MEKKFMTTSTLKADFFKNLIIISHVMNMRFRCGYGVLRVTNTLIMKLSSKLENQLTSRL